MGYFGEIFLRSVVADGDVGLALRDDEARDLAMASPGHAQLLQILTGVHVPPAASIEQQVPDGDIG
jgi:hypothetical protein